MSDNAPPPTPAENQGGATPPPPPPPPAAAPPPPAQGYAPAPGYGAAPTGPRPGELLDRFLARLIDGVLIGVVYAIISIIVGIAVNSVIVSSIINAIVITVLYLGYFSFMESSQGRTLGKQLMKLRVVSASGSGNPTMNEAVKRNLWAGAGILGIIPILGSLLGGLIELAAVIIIAVTINSDTIKRQSWFDKFAGGTQVLKEG